MLDKPYLPDLGQLGYSLDETSCEFSGDAALRLFEKGKGL